MSERFIFLCVRVYPNGEAKETVRGLEGMIGWLAYNRKCRWGNALFVNGVRPHPSDRGGLSENQCCYVESKLLWDYKKRVAELVPEIQTPQFEVFGGIVEQRIGYRAECHSRWFRLPEPKPEPKVA